MNKLPSHLFHGTSAAALPDILAQGIKPRAGSNRDNWRHTVSSNKHAVYLTDTYALYFAMCAAKDDEDLVIIEIDTKSIKANLQADEDVLEQGLRGKDKLPTNWSLKRRTIYYRELAHMYLAELSLNAMGTCAYRGIIPPTAISRICIVPHKRIGELVLKAHDPVICLLNHYFIGEQHKQFHRWLFGDEPVCLACPDLSHDGIEIKRV